ncbi:hypothetical protein EsDP_00001337 [Epichloe bromicola]|uniref:Uncharacterized protein n=1 Tax=Epichloe bromicola TaxID=79588 RepID=A0ABQ0CHK1_9HYPO
MSIQREQTEARCDTLADIVLSMDSLQTSVAQDQSVDEVKTAVTSMAKSVAREQSVCEVKTAIDGMAQSVAREQSVCEARTAVNSLAASLSGVAREQSVKDTIAAVYNVAEMLNNLEGAQLAIGNVVQKVYHLAEGQSANAADRLVQDETLSSSVSDLRTHVDKGFQANLQAIDGLSRCIAECASEEETPNPMVNKLNEIRQAIPTEKQLQRLLGDELRTVGEAVQETLKLDQMETLLNERFEGVAKSLAADLDQLQASLAKDGRDVISDMAAQKGQLNLVVEGSDHMSKALSGVQRDIETVGQIKAHFDQAVARQEAEALAEARRTIASLERELSRSKAADHARAAEVDHLRAALERSENNVSKLGDRVDRLADSLNGVTANASNDRIHIYNLTTQLRQVSDEKARIAVALDDANESITRLTGENSALSDELKAASDREAAALDQADEVATDFLDLDSALVEALSEQPKSVKERAALAAEMAQCRQERHLAMQRATDAEQSAENLRAATLLSAEQAQAAAGELDACQAARDAVAARVAARNDVDDDDDDILSLAFSKMATLTGSMPLIPTHPSHVATGVDNVVANMVEHILRHDKTMDGLAAFCRKGPLDRWFCLTEVASLGELCQYIADPKRPDACEIHGDRGGCLLVQVVLVEQTDSADQENNPQQPEQGDLDEYVPYPDVEWRELYP